MGDKKKGEEERRCRIKKMRRSGEWGWGRYKEGGKREDAEIKSCEEVGVRSRGHKEDGKREDAEIKRCEEVESEEWEIQRGRKERRLLR